MINTAKEDKPQRLARKKVYKDLRVLETTASRDVPN